QGPAGGAAARAVPRPDRPVLRVVRRPDGPGSPGAPTLQGRGACGGVRAGAGRRQEPGRLPDEPRREAVRRFAPATLASKTPGWGRLLEDAGREMRRLAEPEGVGADGPR